MNTTPDFSEAWSALRTRAAAQLPPDFADRVLRTLRLQTFSVRDAADRFFVAACTAAACLAFVVLVHTHNIQKVNQVALADWRQISAQADSYTAVP
ncbi:MAG TPA: hypothetical protein VNV14_07570 [Opitutaceae bacterium]|nr:hypothetical protein [Opitutaceae bacterium]